MSRLISRAALTICIAIPSIALSQPTTAPAPDATAQPATAPAVVVVPADQTTPRGALKVLTQAMEDGDVAKANAIFLVEKDEHRAWADSMLELARSSADVRAAVVAKFGAEGARAVVGDTAMATAAVMGAIDQFTEEIDGDTAMVRPNDPIEQPVQFRKVDGAWRVPLTAMIGNAPAEELKDTADRMNRQVKAMKGFITELQADKFATATDAAQALQLRLVQAVFGDAAGNAPSTAPATQSAPG